MLFTTTGIIFVFLCYLSKSKIYSQNTVALVALSTAGRGGATDASYNVGLGNATAVSEIRPERVAKYTMHMSLVSSMVCRLVPGGVGGFRIVWFRTSLSLSLSLSNKHTHARTHTHMYSVHMALLPTERSPTLTLSSPPLRFSRCSQLIDFRGRLGACRSSSTDDDTPYDPANEPYLKDITRGQICAFMTGFSSFLKETEVTVKSIVQFMPGMRVAIATQDHDVSVFER